MAGVVEQIKGKGLKNIATVILSVGIVLTSIIFLAVIPIDLHILRSIHLASLAIIIILNKPFKPFKETAPYIGNFIDFLLIAAIAVSAAYYAMDPSGLVTRTRISPTPMDIAMATVMVIAVLEISRRTVGNVIVGIAMFFLLYGFLGHHIPGWVGHTRFTFGQVICYVYGYEGIFGIPMQTSASYILLFVVFSAFLTKSGAAKAFVDISLGLCNKMTGGAAKLAIIVNALLGMVSGTPIANVVTTAPFCIPLMEESGMKPVDSSATVAAAAVGSQIIPPVMGAAAFIMIEYMGVSYFQLMGIAVIPAALYMLSLVIATDCFAHRYNLKPVDMENIPKASVILKKQWNVFLAPAVLLFMIIIMNSSLSRAVIYATAAAIVMSWFNKEKKLTFKEIIGGMADGARDLMSIVSMCAAAGIVIGIFSLTGFGLKFSTMLLSLSGGVPLFALLLCMLLVILLGMGLPPTAAYLIPAIMVAPALINMGTDKVAAHMFIFYFSCFAPLTPPVAMAAYTAAPFSKSNPSTVGWVAAKMALAGFIVPFVFTLQPSMLFQSGTIFDSVLAVVAALVGTWAFASGLNFWFFGKPSPLICAVLIVGGLLLIWPGLVTDLIGLALVGGSIVYQKFFNKVSQKEG